MWFPHPLPPKTASVSLCICLCRCLYTHKRFHTTHTHINILYVLNHERNLYFNKKHFFNKYSLQHIFHCAGGVQVHTSVICNWNDFTIFNLIHIVWLCAFCMICLCKPFPCCPSSVLFASTSLFKRLPSSFWTSSFVESYWYCNLDKQWQSEAKERNIEDREKI